MNVGKLHVLIIHFPMALAFAALLADLLWLVTRKEAFRHTALYCLLLAALSAVPAVITGLIVARAWEFGGDYGSILSAHKWWAIGSLAAAILAAATRLFCHNRPKGRVWVAYGILLVAFAGSIAVAGHYGGMLVHGKNFLFR